MIISVDTRTYLLGKIKELRNKFKLFKNSSFSEIKILSETSGPQKFLSDLIFFINDANLAKISYNFFNSDVHIINAGFYSPIWKYFKPKDKSKVILRLDGIGIDNIDQNKDKIKYEINNLIDKSSYLIYQSNFCKNCFLNTFNSLPEGKIIVNGANKLAFITDNAKNILLNINSRFKGNFFTVAGRFSSRKRINEVINQFNSSDIGNLIVLSDVPDNLKYKNPRIIYLGMIDPNSARYLISQSVALIHFDRYDWCPNLVIGAINDRTPVICSNFGGTPEITGKNGIIIKEFPDDLPQNLDGIEYAKKASFPGDLFKSVIYDVYMNGVNLSLNGKYELKDTATEYVKSAKSL